MFAENNKISMKQLKRLLVLDLICVSGLIVPRIATVASGRDGAISIILATLYALVYAFIVLSLAKSMKGDYFVYSNENIGSILTFVIGLLYIFKFFACCVFAARLFSEVIKETLLSDTDNRVIILLLFVLSAYAASKGLEVRARIAEIIYFIILVPVVLFLLLGLAKVDITNLTPILTENTSTIMIGGYEVFLTFSVIELLFFSIPYIKYTSKDKKKGRKLSGYIGQALVIVGVLNLLFFVVSLGILGATGTKQTLWSMVNMIQVIKIPGGFIQRQDAFILGLWMLSIFTLMSGFLFYIAIISKHIFRVQKENYLLIPFIILLFAATAIPFNADEFYDYFSFYMKFIGMPQSILIPLFIVFIGKLKILVTKKSVVRSIFILFTFASIASLTACDDMTEIEDRNFIQAMGIDYKNNELEVNYVLPDLKALTGQSTEEPDSLILTFRGENFIRIEEEYQLRYNKRMDFSHIKAIVLGNDLAKNTDLLKEFIVYATDNYELGKNTLIFLADENANSIIKLNRDLESGVGDYLERLYHINLANTDKEEITLGDFIRGMNNENEVVRVPVISKKEKRIETNGLGIFLNYTLAYQVDDVTADYVELASGFAKNNRFFIKKNIDEEYVIKVNHLRRQVEFSENNKKPFVTIKIEGQAKIEKGIVLSNDVPTREMFYSNETSTARRSLAKEIEDYCNQEMQKKIIENMEDILKSKGIDYLNLYRLSGLKEPKLWKKYEGKMNDFISELEVTVLVNFGMD